MPRIFVPVFLVLSLILSMPAPAPAASVNAGAASWQIPSDVRAEGMGRAVGVLNPGPFAARVNPGALGQVRGFEAAIMQAQLVPDLADGVMFAYQGVAAGLPLRVADRNLNLVVHLNRTWLDYGESIATEPGSPTAIGTFESWEESYGGGLSLGLGSWLGLGVAVKEIEANLAPEEYGDARGTQMGWSYGLLLRSPPLVLHGSPDRGLRFSPSLGVASINHGDEIRLTPQNPGDPLPENMHFSAGARVEIGSAADFLNSRGVIDRAFREVPLWAVTFSAGFEDDKTAEAPPPGSPEERYVPDRTSYGGLEVTWLGVASLRGGAIRDYAGRIKGRTWGFGLALPGRFGLDFASIPQYFELGRVHKTSVWMRVPW